MCIRVVFVGPVSFLDFTLHCEYNKCMEVPKAQYPLANSGCAHQSYVCSMKDCVSYLAKFAPTLAETAVKDRFGSSVAYRIDLLCIIKLVVGLNCGQSVCGNGRKMWLAHDVMTPTCAVRGAITSRRSRLNAAGLQRLRCFLCLNTYAVCLLSLVIPW